MFLFVRPGALKSNTLIDTINCVATDKPDLSLPSASSMCHLPCSSSYSMVSLCPG